MYVCIQRMSHEIRIFERDRKGAVGKIIGSIKTMGVRSDLDCASRFNYILGWKIYFEKIQFILIQHDSTTSYGGKFSVENIYTITPSVEIAFTRGRFIIPAPSST